MSWAVTTIVLALGIAIGYRLPGLRAWWRQFRARSRFRPVLLRPYHPPGRGGSKP